MGRSYRLLLLGGVSVALAQADSIDIYLKGAEADAAAVLTSPAGKRDTQALRGLLPHRRSRAYVEYVTARARENGFESLIDSLERLRLNEFVASPGGRTGSTSIVSRVAVPAVLGAAIEYGGILQNQNGPLTTVRGNLLGIAKLAFGEEQFPYCPEIDKATCGPRARWLRRFSGSISFANVQPASAESTTPSPTPAVNDLFGNDYRMASWGARFDWTGTTNLDDPTYVNRWNTEMGKLTKDKRTLELTEAVSKLFEEAIDKEIYTAWMSDTVQQLQDAPTLDDLKARLASALDALNTRLIENDPNFGPNLNALRRAYSNYFTVRDELLRELHSHKAALEYVNEHPLNQVSTSSLRLVYSHQPTKSPTLITLNAAVTLLNSLPEGASSGRMRNAQLSGQLDRRLSEIPQFGHAVLTIAGYYQWLKEDAIVLAGTGVTAPSGFATIPNTKGHIGVLQTKLTFRAGETVRIPISFTWSNRTELIKERDLRGQIGLTFDFDSLFK